MVVTKEIKKVIRPVLKMLFGKISYSDTRQYGTGVSYKWRNGWEALRNAGIVYSIGKNFKYKKEQLDLIKFTIEELVKERIPQEFHKLIKVSPLYEIDRNNIEKVNPTHYLRISILNDNHVRRIK